MPSQVNKNTPLVTVVTVTYNSSAYVRDAIESILASSYTNFQLIIGDDASTDNTWTIIQEYNDPRILAYRNENNLKEYPNRNKAINLAKGEYLIFIDGDDMIYPHGLEFMVKNIIQFSDCGMLIMYPYLNWIYLPVVISPRDFYVSNFFSKGFNDIAFANTFFKTEMLKEFAFLPTEFKAGDTFIRLRIASKYNTLIVQDQLTWWRETPGQASQLITGNSISIIENFELHKAVLFAKDVPLSEDERDRAIENELYKVKMFFFQCGKKIAIKSLVSLVINLRYKKLLLEVLFSKRLAMKTFESFSPKRPMTIQDFKFNYR